MLDRFHIITATHHGHALQELQQFAIDSDDTMVLHNQLVVLKKELGLEGLYYVSTCNRVLYLLFSNDDIGRDWINQFVSRINPQAPSTFEWYQGEEACTHFFEVASSLNSMVIGEREIVRQLRDAYEQQLEWRLPGDQIRLLFEHTIRVAKEVHAKTKIGERPVSVVSLAIQKILQFSLPLHAKIVMLGAGKTNTLMIKYLKKHGFTNVSVFNRTVSKAHFLAEKVNGHAYGLADLPRHGTGFDCLITCTGSSNTLIDGETYAHLVSNDLTEKLVVDLAVPGDVEPTVFDNFPIHRIAIDDLRDLAATNLEFRKSEVRKAKMIVDQSIEQFRVSLNDRLIEQAFSRIPSEIKAVKEKALQEVFRKEMEDLDQPAQDLLIKMMNYMEKKCIGIPMRIAKETAEVR